MRIALCADGRSPHAVRWANAVVDRGHDVALVWPTAAFDAADLSNFRPSISHLAHDLPSVRWRPWTVVAGARRPPLTQLRPDLVHGFYLSGPGLVAHSLGVHPLVLTALGSDVDDLSRGGVGSLSQRLEEAYVVWRTRRAVADADVVLTDSVALEATIRECMPATETRIIRFGVEVADPAPLAGQSWRRRLGIEDDALVLLSSRLLRPNYNIETIVRALPSIRRDVPDAVLVLKELVSFSDADYRRHILDLAEELNVRDAIRHVGEVERSELLELYRAADIYVSIPSSDGTAVSVLEAMAAGVPVVGSDVPGIDPGILRDEHTALLVPSRDPDALAAAVLRLRADHGRRQQIIENARDVAHRLGDFETELDRAVSLYEQLVADRAGH